MIKYLPYNDIDKSLWDKCINDASNGIVYGYSWYLNSICDRWGGLIMNNYDAVFPLPCNKKWNINYIYQPFFAQQLGIFSSKKIPKELCDSFLSHIPSKFKYIEIHLNEENDISKNGFDRITGINHHINLQQDYEDISKQYSENTVRNIKKAKKNNLQFVRSVEGSLLINLFRMNQGLKVKGYDPDKYQSLQKLIQEASRNNMGEVVGVANENNKLLGAVFLVYSHNRIIYLFPASLEEARASGVMHFLIDSIIKEMGVNFKIFDFEGSMVSSIARFYKSFGSKIIHYPRIKSNRLPFFIKPGFFIHRLLKKI